MTTRQTAINRKVLMRNHDSVLSLFYTAVFTIVLLTGNSRAETPRVLLDGNPATQGIAPVTTSVIPGEAVLVAVYAENSERMHSYSVKCSFNPEIVTFESGAATLSPLTPAFLESAGGKTAAFLAIPGKGTVEIAATQTGNNPAAAVTGSGILGYLSFKAVTGGNPGIALNEARLVDPEGKATFATVK